MDIGTREKGAAQVQVKTVLVNPGGRPPKHL